MFLLLLAHPGGPGKRAVERVAVHVACMLVAMYEILNSSQSLFVCPCDFVIV